MSHATHYPQDEVALNERINELMKEWNKVDSTGGGSGRFHGHS